MLYTRRQRPPLTPAYIRARWSFAPDLALTPSTATRDALGGPGSARVHHAGRPPPPLYVLPDPSHALQFGELTRSNPRPVERLKGCYFNFLVFTEGYDTPLRAYDRYDVWGLRAGRGAGHPPSTTQRRGAAHAPHVSGEMLAHRRRHREHQTSFCRRCGACPRIYGVRRPTARPGRDAHRRGRRIR